jgi:hypothetical protein
LFFNFNEPDLAPRVPNLGTAGSTYDLQIGKLFHGQTQMLDKSSLTSLAQTIALPLFAASDVPKQWDTKAPLVRAAEAGETVTFELPDGTVSTVTAPAAFNQTVAVNVSLANGATATLHLLQAATAPTVPRDTHYNTITVLEDGSNFINMWGGEPLADALNTTAILTSLPSRGVLYQQPDGADPTSRADPVTAVGTPVIVSVHGPGLQYVPASDSFGDAFDSFSYVSHPALYMHTRTHTHPHACRAPARRAYARHARARRAHACCARHACARYARARRAHASGARARNAHAMHVRSR